MARNLDAVDLQLKSCIGGAWKNSTSDSGSYVIVNGVNHKIVDYACMIDGVWRYAPTSNYVWEKYEVNEIVEDYSIYIDDSEEVETEISIHGCWHLSDSVYNSIKLEGDTIVGENIITDAAAVGSGDYYFDGDEQWYYIFDCEQDRGCYGIEYLILQMNPVYVDGGIFTEKGDYIGKVRADTKIYPENDIHTDGYWYVLIVGET